jgi:hypothetical protein
MTVYFIGNSLTLSTTLDRVRDLFGQCGVDLQFGSQLSGGKSLIRQKNYLAEPNEKWVCWETNVPSGDTYLPVKNFYQQKEHRFGLYPEALTKHKFDKVVFQLYDSTLQGDLDAIDTFIDMAIKHDVTKEFYIYSAWPGRVKVYGPDHKVTEIKNIDYPAVWGETYKSNAEDTNRATARPGSDSADYVNKLMAELAKRHPGVSIHLIPTGEVVNVFDAKIKAGLPGIDALAKRDPKLVPGLNDHTTFADGVNVLYADAGHFNPMPHQSGTLGIFISGTTLYTVLSGRSPVGLSAAGYGLDDKLDAELIKAVQQTIWDTVTAEPLTGLSK